MRLHWPGVYGFGLVLSALGVIWLPQHTREFVLTAILMALAGFIAMTVRRNDEDDKVVRDLTKESLQREMRPIIPEPPRSEVIYSTEDSKDA